MKRSTTSVLSIGKALPFIMPLGRTNRLLPLRAMKYTEWNEAHSTRCFLEREFLNWKKWFSRMWPSWNRESALLCVRRVTSTYIMASEQYRSTLLQTMPLTDLTSSWITLTLESNFSIWSAILAPVSGFSNNFRLCSPLHLDCHSGSRRLLVVRWRGWWRCKMYKHYGLVLTARTSFISNASLEQPRAYP